MKKESPIKKHLFWLLLGLVPLLVLIAVFTVSSSVGGKITAKEEEIKKAESKLPSGSAKPASLLTEMDKYDKKLTVKRGDLWKENWERQKQLFTWPDQQPILKRIEAMNLKFGEAIAVEASDLSVFNRKDTYLYQFSTSPTTPGTGTGMADKIYPTQFLGGWQAQLRHVTDWGQKQLTKDQVWLALEDIWIQRSLLDAIRSVNEDMSKFERVRYMKDSKVIDDPNKAAGVSNPTRR